MSDTFSAKDRSQIMRAVKSKGNKSTELRLIAIFKKNKVVGWRRNSDLIGHPDFVFPKPKVAVFADGCFWHGHNCRNTKPAEHADYWNRKIQRNRERDRRVTKTLTEMGWKVVRLWECEIRKENVFRLRKVGLV